MEHTRLIWILFIQLCTLHVVIKHTVCFVCVVCELAEILSEELHRLLNERMHVGVVIDERHLLAVVGEDLFDGP